MIAKVKSTKLLTTGLKNSLQSLSGKLAKPEQEKDLLSFWEVGLEQFENKVKYYVLRDPSAKVPLPGKVAYIHHLQTREKEDQDD